MVECSVLSFPSFFRSERLCAVIVDDKGEVFYMLSFYQNGYKIIRVRDWLIIDDIYLDQYAESYMYKEGRFVYLGDEEGPPLCEDVGYFGFDPEYYVFGSGIICDNQTYTLLFKDDRLPKDLVRIVQSYLSPMTEDLYDIIQTHERLAYRDELEDRTIELLEKLKGIELDREESAKGSRKITFQPSAFQQPKKGPSLS